MKVNTASNVLKSLLIIFSIGVIFLGFHVLPVMAEEMLNIYPELVAAKLPILIMCELLLILLLSGVGIIIYLIVLFDRDFTFSLKFTKWLDVLVLMCLVATIGVIILFKYISKLVVLGLLPSILIIGIIFVILIIAMVIILGRAIVNRTIFYKNDYDLTV